MVTPKTSNDDGPIFDPTDAMFHAHTTGTQTMVECFLLCGQILSFCFFDRGLNGQARHKFFPPIA